MALIQVVPTSSSTTYGKPFFQIPQKELPPGNTGSDVADLICISPLTSAGSEWLETFHGVHIDGTRRMKAAMMMWGASRQLFDILDKYSQAGAIGFLEAFVATIASLEDLRMIGLDFGAFQKEGLHCCTDEATGLYSDYFTNNTCLRHTLLHPVKNIEPIWPVVSPTDQSGE